MRSVYSSLSKYAPRMCVEGRRAFGGKAQQTTHDTIGFIGLGNMGAHMAKNLLKNGKQVIAFDVVSDAVNSVVEAGATAADTPAEVARQSSAIVTMLPSNDHVIQVYTGEDGVFAGLERSSMLIDSSTVDPAVSRKVAVEAEAAGHKFVDAPVSGGVGGAEAGTLTFMVGGSDVAFEESKTVLSLMGANIVHCGDVGTGEVAKLCNNLLLAISMCGTCEAMNLGEKLGIDPKKLAGILNTSTGRCWSSDTYNPYPGVIETAPSNRGYTGGFGSALMHKDLTLALDAAKSENAASPLGSSAHQIYSLMIAHGAGHKDFSAVIQYLNGEHNK